MQQWEILFHRAVKQLEYGKLSTKDWTFGGGTALTLMFNHRHSNDIDIFLADRQRLAYVSPRVNDGAGDSQHYVEQARFTRLYFPGGEIDFIAAPAVTPLKPSFRKVFGIYANMENPVEIVAKKKICRADEFKPRDIFDLAVVYQRNKADFLKVAPLLGPKVEPLMNRISLLETSGEFENQINELQILDGGKKIRGHELELCRDCLHEINMRKDEPLSDCLGR
jgi:predicted nucleotidyltransferase component of viral defense system